MALILVAACAEDHGILVLVKSEDANVTQIRLFVGSGQPTSGSLAIPAATGPTDRSAIGNATYFVRDPHDRGDIVAIDGPRTVRFAYATSDAIPLVIAVGYDSNNEPLTAGVLHDLAAPTSANQFNAYEVDLDTRQTVFGPAGGPDGALRLGVWSRPNSPLNMSTAECAGIQTGNEEVAYFVVNPDDQDCDGYTNDQDIECRPNVYSGALAADPRHPSCLVASPLGTVYPYCTFGGQPCKDGLGPMGGECTATHICTPSSVCTSCGGTFSCATEMTNAQIDVGPFYDCAIHATNDGTRLCGGESLALERPPTGGYDCSTVEIGNADFGDTFAKNGMHVKISQGSPTAGCEVSLDFDDGDTGGASSFTGLTKFTLTNNAGVALPIRFLIAPSDCTDQPPVTCTIANDPTGTPPDVGMTQCAAAWSPVGMVAFVGALPTLRQGGATVTKDGMEMFLIAGDGLYRAQRMGQTWTVSPAPTVTRTGMRAPKLSADGTRLLFMADIPMAGSGLYEVSRTASNTDFDQATLHAIIDSQNRTIESATFGPPGTLVIAAPASGGPTGTQLYIVPFSGFAIGMNAIPIPNVSSVSAVHDRQPSLSYDGLHLYFESDRDNQGEAIYVASRPNIDADFGHPVRLAEIPVSSNTTVYPFVTEDRFTMYYNSKTVGLSTATRGAF